MIRFGNKKDKKQYLKTQRDVFPNTSIKREIDFFNSKVKYKEILVLENNVGYIGHICFQKYLASPPFIDSVFLQEFAIKKKFQGKGFGTLLIKELIKFCKKNKISYVYLGTNDKKGNKAIKFYKRLGFKKLGMLKNIEPLKEFPHDQLFYGLVVKK